ncbi:MAG: hypothetical protein GTO24_22155 [candidate division Zixibacteria bacterium]|nr:hypothetical protein [candidate division Zixibacteria bacterium]
MNMETPYGPVDVERLHSRLFNLGLLLNVLAPAVLIFIGALLKAGGVSGSPGTELAIFFWVLIAVALSEIPAIYIVRRSFFVGSRAFRKGRENMTGEQALIQSAVIVCSLALTPTIYGFVFYLLGGSLERFVLFAAITLFCFLVFKPKLEEIVSFLDRERHRANNAKQP